jgi:UDPglucose 6-dehydrogenase
MCSTIQEAVSDRDLIFIAAPTPHAPVYGGETPTSHLPNQDFDYTIVMDILNEVNKYVNQNQLVILISTVLPGTVRNHLRPCITNARFIYNPYLIAMGTVKWDMVNPEMVIIGTEDGSVTGDAEELIDFYKPMMKNDPRYEVGTWDEAESIKIFYNTFISTKVALVNMIQDVSEANGNINVDVVTNALAKSTHRIMGPSYMTAGMGDGGACHPRDNIALRYLAERLNLGYDLFDAIMRAREVQAERLALRCLKNGKNITIIGKAYKPSVPYTNGSSSMLVGYYIEKHGGNVRYVDPNTGDFDPQTYWTDVYLIGYWEEYVKHFHFPPWCTIIDPWRKYERWVANIKYGDTRPTIKYVNETTTKKYENHFYSSDFPELEPFRDKIGYIEASCAELNAFHRIPAEELVDIIEKYLEQGKTKFIFDGRAEDFKDYIVVKIHKVIKLLGDKVKVSDFYYVLAATNWEKTYEKTKKLHGIDESINLLSHEHFLVFAKQQAENLKHPFEEYQIKTKKKKFLCFNKVCRNHRTLLLEHMFRENLVKDAYYSFFNFTPNYEVFFKNILENKNPKNDYFYALKNNKNLLPLRLNITEERNNPADVITDDLIYTEDSYFSVVTETVFDSQETMYVDLNGEKIE